MFSHKMSNCRHHLVAMSAAMILAISHSSGASAAIVGGEQGEIAVNASEIIIAHSVCREVKNEGSSKIMVPLSTAAEWSSGGAAFLQNLTDMDNVSVKNCGTPGAFDAHYYRYSGGGGGGGADGDGWFLRPASYQDYGIYQNGNYPSSAELLGNFLSSGYIPACVRSNGTAYSQTFSFSASGVSGNVSPASVATLSRVAAADMVNAALPDVRAPDGAAYCMMRVTAWSPDIQYCNNGGDNCYQIYGYHYFRAWPN
ncbi:hypothetical protein ACEUZ9_002895 [Paracoccus litorisediminis]|uniref:hypothetical protein n=1 Tax=Paracoccus litorisediminis TaxID=2006130 RepID=UPI0037316A5D